VCVCVCERERPTPKWVESGWAAVSVMEHCCWSSPPRTRVAGSRSWSLCGHCRSRLGGGPRRTGAPACGGIESLCDGFHLLIFRCVWGMALIFPSKMINHCILPVPYVKVCLKMREPPPPQSTCSCHVLLSFGKKSYNLSSLTNQTLD